MKRVLSSIAIWIGAFWIAASIYLISDNRGISGVVEPMSYNEAASNVSAPTVVLKEEADLPEEVREWLNLLAAWIVLGSGLFFQWRAATTIEERLARLEERLRDD